MSEKVLTYVKENAFSAEVSSLAEELNLSIVLGEADTSSNKPTLYLNKDGLTLCCGSLTLRSDFMSMLPRLRKANLQSETLIKAAKIKDNVKTHIAVDATAGLGEDSLLLAAAGYDVMLFERNPIIAVLLQDKLRRAAKQPQLSDITNKMKLYKTDSINALSSDFPTPDLILLDPMFPARQKSSLVKKKFQLLHLIEQPCTDEEKLLDAAINAHPKKIVIKRPSKGPFLAGFKPSYSVYGNGIRYDCIVTG